MEVTTTTTKPGDPTKKIIDPADVFLTDHARSEKLTTLQTNAYAETVKAYNNGQEIYSAHVLANNTSSNPVRFPTGQVVLHPWDSKVKSISLEPDTFQCMIVCRIVPKANQRFTDDFFQKKLQDLCDSVPQYSNRPISLFTRDEESGDNTDKAVWVEEMGPRGWVDVSKKARPNRVDHDYYITVCASVPVLGEDIIKDIDESEVPDTFQSALTGKLLYWKLASARNACRLGEKISAALGVSILTDNEDEGAVYHVDPDNEGPKVTAQPTYTQYISSVQRGVNGSGGARAGVVYNHASPNTNTNGRKMGYHFVLVSPYTGYVGLKVPANLRPPTVGFPNTTGRSTPSGKLGKVEQAIMEDRARNVTWEGRDENPEEISFRLHPEAYRELDEQFIRKAFLECGWEERYGMDAFIPVITKVATRNPRPSGAN